MSLSRPVAIRPPIILVVLFTTLVAADAAEVDLRTRVLLGLDYIKADFFSHPDVLTYYDEPDEEMLEKDYVLTAGAVAIGLRGVGTEDDIVLAEVMVGRGFIARREYAAAQNRLETALAGAARLGWSDGKANGILRDLAWLAARRGERAEEAGYRARASLCPEPCADDLVDRLGRSLPAMQDAAGDILGLDGYNSQVLGLHNENVIAFAKEAFGPRSPNVREAMRSRAWYAEDDRPWQAIAYYQDLIDFDRAGGFAYRDLTDTRLKIAQLMLEAGEYARLAPFAAELVEDGHHTVALRLRARALWHLRNPAARAAYGDAIRAVVASSDGGMLPVLLRDLVDARYDAETVQVADAFLAKYPGSADGFFAKARVAARAGRFQEAADLVAAIAEPTAIARLQLAFYLDKAGRTDEADAIRGAVSVPQLEKWDPIGAWNDIERFTYPRDSGAYEGAAAYATTYLKLAESMIGSDAYDDAQCLWQIAYALALGGETRNSFRLMREAASIAARLSFSTANATDGGSLQLLRRDKFRYLLFVDIAWAAATGAPPDSMSVSSRY